MNNKAYNNSNIKSHIASYFFTPIFYVVVGLIIFICFILTSCGRAAADSMIQSDRDYIHSIFDSFWGENEWSTVEDYMDSMPYFIIFKSLDSNTFVLYLSPYSTNDYYVARYVNDNATASGVSSVNLIPWLSSSTNENNRWSFGTDFGGLIPYSLGNLEYSSSKGQYGYCIFTSTMLNGSYIGYKVDIGNDKYSASSWNRYWYDSVLHGISNFNSSSGRFGMYVDLAWTKTNFNAAVIHGEYTTESHWEQNVFPITYTEDSRLKFSTSLRGDGERLLNTDLSDFLHWNDEGDTQSVYNVSLTLDCDGSEVVFPLDNTNSEVIFTRNMSNYTYRCVYITPYSELGLDQYDDVTIVKCDFNRVTVNPNAIGFDEDFKISCNYVLKYETAPIEGTVIPLDTSVDSDKLSVVEITDLHNSFQFSEGEFVSDLSDIVAPDNFSFVEICVSTLPLQTLNNILSYVPYILLTPESGVNATQSAEKVIYEYLEDNYYTCVFDYLIFDWVFYDDPEDPSAGYDHLYFYYNTLSGRVRLIDNVLADIYVDVNQNTANTAAIYNYLYTRLNDFEDTSLDALNDIIALDRQRNSWLSTLSSGINNLSLISSNGFADVVDAVNAIEFDYVPFDDSDILSALSGISSLLTSIFGRDDNEDDTVAEAIAYYQSNNSGGLPSQDVFLDNKMSLWMSGKVHVWLQGSNAADSRQGLLIDSFDFMTLFYDSLQSHGLIGGVRNYVRSFTSGTSSGSAETVYKTIWTGSFNPNLKDGE